MNKQDLVQDLIREIQHLKTKLQIAEQNINNLKQALHITSRNNSNSPIHQNNYYSLQSTITTVSNENLMNTKQIQMIKTLSNSIEQLKNENAQQKNKIETLQKNLKQRIQEYEKLKELYNEQNSIIINVNAVNSQLIVELENYKLKCKNYEQQTFVQQQNYQEISFQDRMTIKKDDEIIQQIEKVDCEVQCLLNVDNEIIELIEKTEQQLQILLQL